MSRIDRLALLLSLVVVVAAWLVADRVYERMPHFEDEMAYVWQAQVIADGHLTLPSPPDAKSFLVPFVIDYRGQRFGKYPPGWPSVLALGVKMGLRDWVNPLLAGAGIWLTYLLVRRITSERIGLLAAFLFVTSPLFWLLSGSLLSHAWSLVVTLGFVLAWLDSFELSPHEDHKGHSEKKNFLAPFLSFVSRRPPKWLTVCVAGLSLGVLILTRPITTVGVALPFAIHGLILLRRGDWAVRRRVLAIGLTAMLVGGLLFAWQFAVTGDPLKNPYTLWWSYDKFGFGEGYGRQESGHNLLRALFNIKHSLVNTGGDLFGWGIFWWLFLPFGLWALWRRSAALLVAGIFPALLLAYVPYWIGSWQYGPRYYYEGLLSLALLSAGGVFWLAGEGQAARFSKLRIAMAVIGTIALIGNNLFNYLPGRLWKMHGMYGISRAMLTPLETAEARALTPALVIVHYQNEWTEYGGLLELQNATLTSPFIFAISRGFGADKALADDFPDRRVLHYYPDEPNEFYDFPIKP